MNKFLPLLVCLPLCAGSPRDTYMKRKAAHALIGYGVYKVCEWKGHPKTGLALAWGLGIGKELYDQKHGGAFRSGDIAWTGLPATVSFSVKW